MLHYSNKDILVFDINIITTIYTAFPINWATGISTYFNSLSWALYNLNMSIILCCEMVCSISESFFRWTKQSHALGKVSVFSSQCQTGPQCPVLSPSMTLSRHADVSAFPASVLIVVSVSFWRRDHSPGLLPAQTDNAGERCPSCPTNHVASGRNNTRHTSVPHSFTQYKL